MSVPFPEPTTPMPSRAAVLLRYLDYFRDQLVRRLETIPAGDLRASALPSGWAPIELLSHLIHTERRWLEWRFEGTAVPAPWGEDQDGRWHVLAGESLQGLVAALRAQAARTRSIVAAHELTDLGQPGDRWPGDRPASPASLERILLHLLQEYARHVGQLDIVSELAGGAVGE